MGSGGHDEHIYSYSYNLCNIAKHSLYKGILQIPTELRKIEGSVPLLVCMFMHPLFRFSRHFKIANQNAEHAFWHPSSSLLVASLAAFPRVLSPFPSSS